MCVCVCVGGGEERGGGGGRERERERELLKCLSLCQPASFEIILHETTSLANHASHLQHYPIC